MTVPQPTLEPLRRWDPERIGPYALLGRLGAGAMGQVYLGRSQAGRQVAVKTIKIELAEEPGFRDHFAHEVAAARRVSGMFTAAVVAADAEADVPWLATAYIPAPSLSRLVRSCGPQPVPAIWWLAAGCAEALESIHGAGLVHRDLKPSNVLVAPDGPRVIDFGVARAAERIALTVTRGAVGTPAYMAPEQARDTRQASMASDIFALGATLLFAATGHPPYQGETVMDVLVRLATEPPDLTGLPAELTDIIVACLQRSPRDRPTSAALLTQLADGTLAGGGQPDGGDALAYLSEPAMAVIREYQRGPRLAVRQPSAAEPRARAGAAERAREAGSPDAAEDSAASQPSLPSDAVGSSAAGDASEPGEESEPGEVSDAGASDDAGTYASHLALPEPLPVPADAAAPAARRRRSLRGRRSGQKQPRQRPAEQRSAEQRSGRHDATFGLAGRTVAAILLVGVGAGIGSLLGGSGSAGTNVRVLSGLGRGSTGAGLTPPPGGPPPSQFPTAPAGSPAIVTLQPVGDGNSGFVVHGTGWKPGSSITVTLAGHGTSPVHPIADQQGAFNYTIDQGHLFFSGPIPPGIYQVIVTSSAGGRATVRFQVVAPPARPAPSPSTSAA